MKALTALLILMTGLYAASAMAETINGSKWLVTGKTCSGQNQPVAGKERMQFDNGFFAHIYQSSETSDEVCYQAQAFVRIVQSFSNSNGSSAETSVLSPQALRTVCSKKQGGARVSDKTEPLNEPVQTLTITVTGNHAIGEIGGSPSCLGGTLRFELKKL